MKRIGNLYEQICSYDNLFNAYIKARRNKRFRPEVIEFFYNLEDNLLTLRDELLNRTYTQGNYRQFTVYEPKIRQISALPFRDRVVQHAINNIMEPIFDKSFIYHSYACRVGKGVHSASNVLYDWIYNLEQNNTNVYYMKMDISKYFQNINHIILINIIKTKIKCKPTISLLIHIIKINNPTGQGIPVGNLLSQLFANIYLNILDQYLTNNLHYYIRYMDDFIILDTNKQKLNSLYNDIETFIIINLKLELNPKSHISHTKNGIPFLGYLHYSSHKRLKRNSVLNMRYKLRNYTDVQLELTIPSWKGHAKHANTYRLINSMNI